MKTVLVTGLFSVLHPGHLRLFRFAKECGDKLIVGVFSDKMSTAWVSERLRLEGVQSNSWVDEAFLIDESIEQVLRRFKPDIVVKGKEHETKFNPELQILDEYGGKLIFSSGEVTFSSLDLIRQEFLSSSKSSVVHQHDYLERHDVRLEKLGDWVEGFSKLRICVIGDLIVDEYITCQPLGMSQEDPTLVVMPIDSVKFVGGAGIVAAHAASLGASVEFVSVTGLDVQRDFAGEQLKASGVKAFLFEDGSRPTTLKQRYRSQGKSLLRVSQLHQGAIGAVLQDSLFDQISKSLEAADLLVFSDFNYGCLPQKLVDRVIGLAKDKKVMIVADSQSSSQTGHIGRFKNMDVITPTEREARISTRNNEDGLVVLVDQLCRQSQAKHVLLKLGQEGVLIHAHDMDDVWLTDRIDALNTAPKDVAGAGDSLLITSAMALAAGASIWEAAYLGSLAAAIQVGRVGNTPIKRQEFLEELA